MSLTERLSNIETLLLSFYKHPLLSQLYVSQFKSLKILKEPLTEGVLAVLQHLQHLDLQFQLLQVDSTYYDWSLEKRALVLKAPTLHHLCKSILFENTRYHQGTFQSELDPRNSRYYLVVVQYTDKISTQKLLNFVRELGGCQIARKKYNFRLADQDKAAELTGFIKNGVCPFGK
jgi:hypothetical protein